MYDLIGDIHGCAKTLEAMLEKLGYVHDGICYRHPERQVIFLGDFVDRGPFQRETIKIAMDMVQNNSAKAVMGNHEFNAIAYHTPDPENPGHFLRPHNDNDPNDKNKSQHKAFLEAFSDDTDGKKAALDWFRTLPLWLDLGEIRVVHACWHPRFMEQLEPLLGPGNTLTEELLVRASRKGSETHDALETILKGKEVKLPNDGYFYDKEEYLRHHVRIKWWERDGTFRTLSIGATSPKSNIPDEPFDLAHLVTYGHEEPPVFLGHYWLSGKPKPLADNVACLDYSVAKTGGKLVAYCWDGKKILTDEHFVSVNRLEP